jgi:hypothetical protein
LKAWVEEESRSARIYRRLAETAVLHREGGAGLWRDPDLQVALKWRDKDRPNHVWAQRYHSDFNNAVEFLDKSKRRRRLVFILYCLLIALGMAMLSGMAWYRQRGLLAEARANEIKARENEKKANEKASTAEVGDRLKNIILDGLKPDAAELALKLINEAKKIGIEVRLISGYLSLKEQNTMYEQGRTTPGPLITRARVSSHNTGLAFDVAVVKDGKVIFSGPDFQILGGLGETLGLVWGGRFERRKDPPHFETKDAQAALRKLSAGAGEN